MSAAAALTNGAPGSARASGSAPPARPGRDAPRRRCLATGAVLPKQALIRFVVAPDGVLTPDLERRLPGRGMWVSADRGALERAVAKGLFGRAARRKVDVPDGLIDRIDALLTRRCLHLIGLARRAGEAVAGFGKVRAWLDRDRAAVLVAASDGASDGRAKMRARAPDLPIVEAFDAAELGAAFGRDRAVHGALAVGGLATLLVAETARLKSVRAGGAQDGTGAVRH